MFTLREFICFNQKELIRFEYTISQLHKEFRIALDEDNIELHEEKYNALILESFTLLHKVFEKNSKYIMNTFGKNNKDLRVSIKMIDDDNVVDIFRNTQDSMLFSQSKISQNSGFNTIKTDKTLYYLNEDIEESFKKGTYKNHRLDDSKKDALINGKINWEECWIPYSDTGKSTSYNSTLIIPMSITSEEEDKDTLFYKNFFEKQTEGKTNTPSRTIWGYLCLDSQYKNFFSDIKDFDVLDLGFIITDILSLYLVFFYNYTSGSDTVSKYLENKEEIK